MPLYPHDAYQTHARSKIRVMIRVRPTFILPISPIIGLQSYSTQYYATSCNRRPMKHKAKEKRKYELKCNSNNSKTSHAQIK